MQEARAQESRAQESRPRGARPQALAKADRAALAAQLGEVPVLADSHDELASRLRIAVTRLNRRLRQQTLVGISPSQESALATINRLGNPTLGELAQAEQVQPPTMTRVVATMEVAGLVARRGEKEDRRICRVELTRAGRTSLERSRSLKNAYLARQIGRLGEEERVRAGVLTALLEQLVEDA